ncbi:MAG: glycine--tRNA ligase [Oscillospiraceae bacterium]|jgi:glycyl-tRNA synthetase|nr:glycine--tRNA ligase [Oscillospiraceae bacterium]
MDNTQKSMEKIVALCKGRGFIYPGSEIYGGLANTWDYGPLGVELKNNIKAAWWKKFVRESPFNVGLDSGILMNPAVWKASGHLKNFNDPLMDCRKCKTRHRADKLIESNGGNPAGMSFDQMGEWLKEKGVACPDCEAKDFTAIRQFNMMFKTFQGVNEDTAATVYLRPETAQGIFVQFKNIQRSSRRKVPFGIAQIGKSFRNEITPGNFIFRTREFEQMELEFFCKPGTDLEWFDFWKEFCKNWLIGLGLKQENVALRDHDPTELSHYSAATTDIEFLYPFGWGELWGIADRTDYDLKCHQAESGESMEYFDAEANEKYIPCVVEPSLGVDRVLLAFLIDAYDEEILADGDMRTILRLHPALAPVKCAVLPLSKKLSDGAVRLCADLKKRFHTDYDDAGAIGRRYRRQDEIGTPFCVTYDFDSERDLCVTVRDRDTMEQERVPIDEVAVYIETRLAY